MSPKPSTVKNTGRGGSRMHAVTALVIVLSTSVSVLPAWGFAPPGPGGAQAMTPLPDSGLETNLSPSLGSPPALGSPPNLGAPPDVGPPPDTGVPPSVGPAPDMGSPPDLGKPPDVGSRSQVSGSASRSDLDVGTRSVSDMGAASLPSSTPSGLTSPAAPGSSGAAGGQ